MDWWRCWHGAPTDLKWPIVAKKATEILALQTSLSVTERNCYVTCVTAVTWVLFDVASQAKIRGDVTQFNAEAYAHYAQIPVEKVEAIIAALHDKNVLKDNAFVNWSKRQGSDIDGAAERMRRYRERQKSVTERNRYVTVTQIREDKNIPPIVPQGSNKHVLVTPSITYAAEFEKLWNRWRPYEMTKGNKTQAAKSYEKAMKTGVTEQDIGRAAMSYCDNCQRRQLKTQHLSTWLNQHGWETPPEPKRSFYDDPMNRMPSPAGG